MPRKRSVLLIGGGAVGTIAAINLELGGLAAVTAVLRSNYTVVSKRGFKIESVDHGSLDGWRPTKGFVNFGISIRPSNDSNIRFPS